MVKERKVSCLLRVQIGTSLNCFGSIDLKNGHLISSFHERGNAEATIEHFQKVRDAYEPHISLAFIIDNATWHKTQKVKDFCEENNITLLFYLHIVLSSILLRGFGVF